MKHVDRSDFERRFQTRLPAVRKKTKEEFRFSDVSFSPYNINRATYVLFGVLASAFGARIYFPDKEDPAVDSRSHVIGAESDIETLPVVDPERDDLMPKVLQFMRHMKDHSFLPVGITDCQGPLTTACQLMGYDKLFYLMHDNPRLVHVLMDRITGSLILWIEAKKSVTGEARDSCFGDQLVYIGDNAGVWMSDDDAVIISFWLYGEFVVPYNSRVFQAFDGGILHYCGNANHQIDNFLPTGGLIALNVYCLHNLESLAQLKRRIDKKKVLIGCDYTPRLRKVLLSDI